jgi:hypothetical protein
VKDRRRRLVAVWLLGTTVASLAAASSAPSQATWLSRVTILGPHVTSWDFDQASGTTAFAHVAVKR